MPTHFAKGITGRALTHHLPHKHLGTGLLHGGDFVGFENVVRYVSETGVKFSFTWTLLMLQTTSNVLGAMAWQTLRGPKSNPPGVPVSAFLSPAITYLGAMVSSNEALK
jgi:hypothetical protein